MLWQTFPLLLVAQKNFIHKEFYVIYKVPTPEKIKRLLYCLEWRHGSIDDVSHFSKTILTYPVILPPASSTWFAPLD